MFGLQAGAALKVIDNALATLHEKDPSMYYEGDFNQLLERRHRLKKALEDPEALMRPSPTEDTPLPELNEQSRTFTGKQWLERDSQ
jgi:hypothetical protein